jgi:capsular polysaccharide transport system ATP-binding protein
MIQLDGVTKYFDTNHGRKYILNNVSMTIPGGVNVGILGRNGAGKSTFLKMLGGVDFPNSGKIVSDKRFSWRLGLASGFQGSLSGRDNAKFVCRVYSRTDDERRKTLDFIQAFSELDDYFDMPVKTYSSGMKSRLAFAMSMAFHFDYYLIDESMSAGDAKFKIKCTKALKGLRTISNFILVNHNPGPLRSLCDVGIVLKDGQLFYFNNVRNAIKWYQLQ